MVRMADPTRPTSARKTAAVRTSELVEFQSLVKSLIPQKLAAPRRMGWGATGRTTWAHLMATHIPRRAELGLPDEPPLPPNASAGRRWRFRRDMAIYALSRSGFSQRYLGDVFDLPHSRIAAIIKDFSALCGYTTD